jgi:hypothetical protein
MKHLKMLGLIGMAAAALLAFAGSASAATFTAPAGTAYTGSWGFSLEGSTILKAGFAEITCTSDTMGGSLTTNNETEASGSITSVALSGCGSSTVDTLNSKGTLKIAKSTHAVSGTGVEITTAALGTSCVYGFGSGTSLGTASNTASGITISIDVSLGKVSGGFLCANPATWKASYIWTTPKLPFLD